ncbi:polymorphic toxin-type HINT domain-containing protein, partial [Leptospira neocaledonica]
KNGTAEAGFFNQVGEQAKIYLNQLAGNAFGDFAYINDKGEVVFRSCFVAGTLVHTKDGLRAIETIKVGDEVLSKSDETGGIGYKRVSKTFVRQTETIFQVIFVDGSMLETTWNHPFRRLKAESKDQDYRIENSEWKEAKDLHSGDITITANGEILEIEEIIIENRFETVYNFVVDDFHTYFVGEVGVWVHNQDYSNKYSDKRAIHDEIEAKLDIKNHVADVTAGGLLNGALEVAKSIGKTLYSGAKGALGFLGIALEVGSEGYAFQKKLKDIAETYDTKDAIRLMDDLLMREEKKAKREFNDVNGGLDILIKKRKDFLDTIEGKTTYDTTVGDRVDLSINEKRREHNKEVAYHIASLKDEKIERNSFNQSYNEKVKLMDQARTHGENGDYRSMIRVADKALMYRGHSDGYAEFESIKNFQTVKTIGLFSNQVITESPSKAPTVTINPTLEGIQKAYLEYMETREQNIQDGKKTNCQNRSYNGGYFEVPICYSN